MISQVYTAKAALFDRLTALAGVGQPLEGLQVEYAFPLEPGLECVYGGGVRFTQQDAVAERGVLIDETALVSVYVRVAVHEAGAVQQTDARAAQIGGYLAAALNGNPQLTAGLTWLGVGTGQGDYDQAVDETVSILALQMRIASELTYGTA